MRRVALLEVLDDAQRMQIVVEPPSMIAQAPVQRPLAGVAKRRMPDVVDQRQRLRQIFVQPQRRRRTARAICATSIVWVSRLRKWSEARLVNTCVLPARRRKARACTMRSRSR